MAVELKYAITYRRSPEMLKKKFNPLLKLSLRFTGQHWFVTMLPKHFKEGAGRIYKYKERTKGHIRRKLKKFGHRRPLEFTGVSKRRALGQARLRGTAKKIRVIMPGLPKYFFAFSTLFKAKEFGTFRMGKKVDKVAEMTRVTKGEATELAKFLHDKQTLEMENLRNGAGRETVRIG